MSGFFRLRRGWRDNPAFQDEPASERESWVWLIEEAAFQDRRKRVGNVVVAVRRGQIATSIRFLATAWKWSPSKVNRFLSRLADERMVETDASTGVTLITVCNYDKYQIPVHTAGTGSGTAPEQGVHDWRNGDETRNDDEAEQLTHCFVNEISEPRNIADTPVVTSSAQIRNTGGTNYKEIKDSDGVETRARVSRPTPETKAIVQAFDAERDDAFGPEQARLAAHHTDHVFAGRWLEAGADLDLCRGVFTRVCRDWARDGRAPPGTLKAFDAYVLGALADVNAAVNTPLHAGPQHEQHRPSSRNQRPGQAAVRAGIYAALADELESH